MRILPGREVPGTVIRSAEIMSILKTCVRWFLRFLRYMVVSEMIGNLADNLVFIPLKNEIFRMLEYGEEVEDQVGEEGASGPGGCGEGEVGKEDWGSGGGRV